MSLNWNASKCEGQKQIRTLAQEIESGRFAEEELKARISMLDALIAEREAVTYYMMAAQINALNARTLKEFVLRVQMYDRLFGRLTSGEHGLTYKRVGEMWLGLQTNVPTRTQRQLGAVWMDGLFRDARYALDATLRAEAAELAARNEAEAEAVRRRAKMDRECEKARERATY